MKGDFSRWDAILEQNVNGVLHQQGRVLLDRDWNDQRRLTGHWQDRTGQHVLGRDVLAVPAGTPDAFKVTEAAVDDGRIRLTVHPGAGWADGLAVELRGTSDDRAVPATREAAYLGPPLQVLAAEVDGIAAGVRDAVILEVWREELHGFQRPDLLIEPALGGLDTTERIHTAMRFRLFRMQPEDTCQSIASQLRDDPALKGRLTVSLDPTTTTDGDCPTVESGGYVGFEHALYRIEIARVDAPTSMFKWSRFNGGLVGRGQCELGGADPRIVITANDQAIKTAGRDDFYLEVVAFDADRGHWRVTYGAEVTLNGDDLEVGAVRYQEPQLPTGRVFFRLWDGIAPIDNYLDAPNGLRDGICLAFEAPGAAAMYRPGDYWTFNVRAGSIANDPVLIDDEPPGGITYHRVPLAEIDWNAASDSFEAGDIADCRKRFRPLTGQHGCCTFSVGDGRHSRGDFTSIEEALQHLPPEGGQICILPGTHRTNAVLLGRRNVRIRGCGRGTRMLPREGALSDPVFRIQDSSGITLESLDIVAAAGTGILVEESEYGVVRAVTIADNRLLALGHGIDVIGGQDIEICSNTVRILDREKGDVGISIQAEGAVVEGNDVRVIPFLESPEEGDEQEPPVLDPSAEPQEVFQETEPLIVYAAYVWTVSATPPVEAQYRGRGGIQVHAGSERVRLRTNQIIGGAGNGITLGSAVDFAALIEAEERQGATLAHESNRIEGQIVDAESGEPVEGMRVMFTGSKGVYRTATTQGARGTLTVEADPDDYWVTAAEAGYDVREVLFAEADSGTTVWQITVAKAEDSAGSDFADSLAFLYDLTIEDNEISGMGRSGVGVPNLDLSSLSEETDPGAVHRLAQRHGGLAVLAFRVLSAPVAGLVIANNRIRRCLLSPPTGERGNFLRGEGGISLGLAERLQIKANTIDHNGPDHLTPVCGIFVLNAERADISCNQVWANGPMLATPGSIRPGIRGGIVVLVASATPLLERPARDDEDGLGGHGLALRAHENVVEQPLGRAFTVGAWGSLSVQKNLLHTVTADQGFLGAQAGAVLVVNVGGMDRTSQIAAALANEEIPARSVTGMAADVEARHPDGNTLFLSNQVRLDRRRGSRTAQLIVSLDDLSYSGNQAEVRDSTDKGSSLSMNAVLCGATLRVLGNRFIEPPHHGTRQLTVSAFTAGLFLNNTSNNQGNHCILGATAVQLSDTEPRVLSGNQTLFSASDCKPMNDQLGVGWNGAFSFLYPLFVAT